MLVTSVNCDFDTCLNVAGGYTGVSLVLMLTTRPLATSVAEVDCSLLTAALTALATSAAFATLRFLLAH